MAYNLTKCSWKVSKLLSHPQLVGWWCLLVYPVHLSSMESGVETSVSEDITWKLKLKNLLGHLVCLLYLNLSILKSSKSTPSKWLSKTRSQKPPARASIASPGTLMNWNQRLRALWKYLRSPFTPLPASPGTHTKNNISWTPTPLGAFLFMKAILIFFSFCCFYLEQTFIECLLCATHYTKFSCESSFLKLPNSILYSLSSKGIIFYSFWTGAENVCNYK